MVCLTHQNWILYSSELDTILLRIGHSVLLRIGHYALQNWTLYNYWIPETLPQTFALKIVVLQLPTYAQYEYSISYYIIKNYHYITTDIASARDNIIL